MPLPAAGTPWPPHDLDPVTDHMQAWHAWYAGDPDELAWVYSGAAQHQYPRTHPSQYRGGVLGTLARWWWGQPTPYGERRAKPHVPLAADLAVLSADLLYGEPPTLTVPDQATQKRLDQLIDDGVITNLREGTEIGAALGGHYLRVVWDTDVRDRPWITAAPPDAAVPDWAWDRLRAVTFWRVLNWDDNEVVRHVERHEPGVILHAVYVGTPQDLGRPVDLGGFEETANLPETVETGLPPGRLTAAYVPNVKPNRLWGDISRAAPLGRSDIQGVEPFLDALDEAYASWLRDIRLAKARLIVPNTYLESLGKGQGAVWDVDREVYSGMDMLAPAGENAITPNQFAIRTTEHQETCDHWAQVIIRGAGYSAQSLGMEGEGGMITATEVDARESRSVKTRGRKIRYATPPLKEIVETLLLVDKQVFASRVTPAAPEVTWPEASAEDPLTLAQTAVTLRAAGAASLETTLRIAHPTWDEKQITDEMTRIHAEPPPINLRQPNPAPGGLDAPAD